MTTKKSDRQLERWLVACADELIDEIENLLEVKGLIDRKAYWKADTDFRRALSFVNKRRMKVWSEKGVGYSLGVLAKTGDLRKAKLQSVK